MAGSSPRDPREIAVRALLVCASLVVSLGACELGLRAWGFSYSPLRISVAGNPGDWRYRHAFTDSHFIYDPHAIWRPRPNVPPFNGEGFRGALLKEEPTPGTLRILAMGDSNTLGWLGENDGPAPSWPLFMEEYFGLGDQRLKVTNAGVYGHTSFQGLRLLQQLLPHLPDVVLVSYGCNDAHPVLIPDAEFMEWTLGTRVSPYSTGIFRLRLAQVAATAWDRRIARHTAPDGAHLKHRVPLADYRAYLAQMAAACAAQGALCVFLTRPHLPASTDPAVWSYHAPPYYRATIEVAAAADVPLIDLYARFKDEHALFADDSHFSVEGHREAARFVSAELARILAERGSPAGSSTDALTPEVRGVRPAG